LPPVRINGRYLVDGGLVNVVPVSVCRDLGADFVIGVNVIPVPKEDLSIQEACEKYYDYQLQSAINDQESLPVEHGSNYRSHLRDIEKGIKNFLLYRLSRQKKKLVSSIDCTIDDKTAPPTTREPSLFTVVSQTLSIIEYRIAMENLKKADIAITPFSGNIGFWQFLGAKEAITAGEIATRLVLQRNDIAKIILDDTRSAN
jgi:NTE family protein